MQPTLNCRPHFGEMAFEEMVSGDEYQLFRVGGFGNEFLQRILRAVLIVVAADEELGFGAVPQERKRVKASIGFDRRTDRDDCVNVRLGTRSLSLIHISEPTRPY